MLDSRLQAIVDTVSPKTFRVLSDISIQILCPVHDDKNPSCSVFVDKEDRIGVHCYSGCDGKTVRDAVLQISGLDTTTETKLNRTIRKADFGSWISPLPQFSSPCTTKHRVQKLGTTVEASVRYEYMGTNGKNRGFCTQRWEWDEEGTRKKTVLPFTYISHKTDSQRYGWCSMVPPGPKLLYGLEQLGDDECYKKSCLIVEGEKCADVARKALPEWVVLTWQGGSSAVLKAEWDEIKEPFARTVLWPDNDAPGMKWVRELKPVLAEKHHTLYLVQWGENRGDDCADVEAAGESITTIVESAQTIYEAEEAVIRKWCNRPENPLKIASCKGCSDTNCRMYGRLNKPADIRDMSELEREWILVQDQQAFYSVLNPERPGLSQTGFNLAFGGPSRDGAVYSGTGQNSAVGQFLGNGIGTKVENITWDPGQPSITNSMLNTWRPVKTKPSGDLEPTMWLELVEHIIPDYKAREHILDYLAAVVQLVGQKINHAPLIISEMQGIGKSSITAPLRIAFGSQAIEIGTNELVGAFNFWLPRKRLVIVEELFEPRGRYAIANKLKMYLAAPPDELPVDEKHTKQYHVKNRVQFFMYSNHDNALSLQNANDAARRWFIYYSSAGLLKQAFYSEYYKGLGTGNGVWSVYKWLMERNISEFDIGAPPPMTDAKRDMQRMADPAKAWVVEGIEEKTPPFDTEVTCIHIIDDYLVESVPFWSKRKLQNMRNIRRWIEEQGYQMLTNDKNGIATADNGKRVIWQPLSRVKHIFWSEMKTKGENAIILAEIRGTCESKDGLYKNWVKERSKLV